jgi:hypothetical protein
MSVAIAATPGSDVGRYSGMGLRPLGMVLVVCAMAARIARGEEIDRPPDQGGFTHALGIPSLMRTYVGAEYESYKPAGDHELGGLLNVGAMHYLGHPIVGLGGLGLELYGGGRAQQADFGARGYFTIPSLLIGAGMDYNAESDESDFILKLELPMRRGGVVGIGSAMTLRWLPTRDQTFTVGVSAPFGDADAGRTRPRSDYVKMDARRPRRLTAGQPFDGDSTLRQALAFLDERARWIAELTQPFSEYGGADAAAAMQPRIRRLREHMMAKDDLFPNGHTLNEEVRVYHEVLDRAFSIADSGAAIPAGAGTARGRHIGAEARRALLDDVLFRYNALFGQLKKKDTLSGMIAVAQANFARGLLSSDNVDRARAERHFFVFQSLCKTMEENRAALGKRWGDSRHVWLPLQYGLKPEEHDTQEELDRIIERATRQRFTAGNQVWYIVNEEFQSEVARSVRAAQDYHVLWIHDVSGYNHHGEPDAIGYEQACNYLLALAERVRAYDDTGKLPEFIIFLDQHFFEAARGRLWMELLEDPMRHRLHLPRRFASWEDRVGRLQEDLRTAVGESVVLQMEKSQYGEDWLHNRIRVQVNITNPADYSFYSMRIVGMMPVADNHMRDHRKIVFYDITEDDPYRGMAMFTGMGLGEHYAGATWEDRALLLRGPAALETKNAARFLLQIQGFREGQIPFPLRSKPKPESYDDAVKAEIAAQPIYATGRVIELHNETGFTHKPLNVTKGVLYSLMPPGSIMKVPDSLWQSYIYASLMAGSALRGCRALVMAPSLLAAPSAGSLQMARANGLLKRLVVFGNAMDDYMEREGGILRVGLYAPRQGVGDIAGRMRQAVSHGKSGKPSWKERVYHLNPEVEAVAENARAVLDTLGYRPVYLTPTDSKESPKLHLKANFFASARIWDDFMSRPEWAGILEGYIQYLALQQGPLDHGDASSRDVRAVPRELKRKLNDLETGYLAALPPERRSEMICYLTVGSANMDYRSQVMNGEVMVAIGGMAGLEGVLDFMILAGLCDWPGTPEDVDALVPPPGGFVRRMSSFIKIAL